jgi:cation:H+ antiporter
MLLSLLLLVGGLVLLVAASDQLVTGSSRLAVVLRVPPVVIGVVVIGFGTSAPELLVSGLAALRGSIDLATGNIVGSNVANLLLVLGAAAAVAPLTIPSEIVRREVPLALVAVAAFAWVLRDGLLVSEAVALVLLLVAVLGLILVLARFGAVTLDPAIEELQREGIRGGAESVRALLGLAGTLAGAQGMVVGAVDLAARIGLDEGLIGLTVVAVGTSLPELATAGQSARRGESGLLLGNLLGSNVFNATAVGAVVVAAGAAEGLRVGPSLAGSTLVMVAVAVAVSLLLVIRSRISRAEGALLLLAYAAFAASLPALAR